MLSFKLSNSKQSIEPFKELSSTPQSFQPTMSDKVKGWFRLNSFGGRLFWMIMLGAVLGMGGMAFLFSEMLKRQAQEQVRSSIDSKANAISSVTDSAETLAYSLGVSATTLHERGAQFPDTYRELVLQLFERRPDFVVGLGLGQSENGILEEQPWLFPYYSAATSSDAIRYEDFADDVGEFYPETERYQNYFEPQKSLWTEPYQGEKNRLLTYYYPLFNSEGDWLGTSLVDIDSQYLGNLLDDVVFQKAGYFLLMTQSGMVITNPKNPATEIQTYQNIPELEPIWSRIDISTPGLLKGESGYWAYANVPGQDWLLLGFVPYDAIYGRILRIAALTTGLMVLLLGAVVYLAIRKLNQRIKPILLQGKQFAGTEGNLMAEVEVAQKDELEQLSMSFFNILDQLNLHQDMIRRYEDTIAQSNLHSDQMMEKFLAFTAQIDEEAREQHALIEKVQSQLAKQSNEYKSVDSRLDALFTLAQTLGGYLDSLPSETESAQLFDSLDQRILALTGAAGQVNQGDQAQFQGLLAQLIADVANLKAYDRQRHSLEKLQDQTSDITQSRQATIANSQAMVSAAQTITQILTEIESITSTLNNDAKQVSDMLWGGLEHGDDMDIFGENPGPDIFAKPSGDVAPLGGIQEPDIFAKPSTSIDLPEDISAAEQHQVDDPWQEANKTEEDLESPNLNA